MSNFKLIDMFTTWCFPCKNMAPIVEKIVAEFDNVQLIKIDVEEDTDIAVKYGVRSVPTFILLKDNQIVDRLVGAVPASEFKEFITKNM